MSRRWEKLVLFTTSTCGLGGSSLGKDEKEVCLLSWQVLDTGMAKVVSPVEVCYVSPKNPPSAPKTPQGIPVSSFTSAPPFNAAIKKFQSVLSSLPEQSTCLVTNGPLPLRQVLFPELSKKDVPVPRYIYSFFDILKEVGKAGRRDTPATLSEACDYLSIPCPSTECFGEEEIKILADIVLKLLSDGYTFESPEMIQQHYQHTNKVNPGDIDEGCVIKLKGLLYSADHTDVARFFSGLNIIPGGLAFSFNAMGRRTGEAVAVLENTEQMSLALQRDRHYMDKRYIEVYEAAPEDFLDLVDSGISDSQAYVLRMQGLPYRANEEDICNFFGRIPIKNGKEGVLIVQYPDGRASGDAFALFSTEDDLREALKRDREDLMGRYVEVFRSSIKEFRVVLNKSGTREQLDNFSYLNPDTSSTNSVIAAKRGVERNCVKLRGLPWEASAEDVIDFFDDLSRYIEQQGVHMVLNAQNRPTGDCYVQMTSVESASRAVERLNRKNMGRRYIEIFQCSGNEVTYALMDSAGGRSNGPSRSGGKRMKSSGATIKARGLPYSTTECDLVDFFTDFNISESDIEIVYSNAGNSMGIAYIAFPTPGDAKRAVRELNNKYIGPRYVELSLSS